MYASVPRRHYAPSRVGKELSGEHGTRRIVLRYSDYAFSM